MLKLYISLQRIHQNRFLLGLYVLWHLFLDVVFCVALLMLFMLPETYVVHKHGMLAIFPKDLRNSNRTYLQANR